MNKIILNETSIIKGGMNMVQILEDAIKAAKENNVPEVLLSGAKRVLKNLANDKAGEEELVMALSSLKISQSGGEIKDNKTLMKFVKVLKTKEYLSMLSVTIDRDKYGAPNGLLSTDSTPIGRAFADMSTEDEIIVPVGAAGHTKMTRYGFAPFSKDLISIKFKSENDLKRAEDDGIYVIFAGRNTKAFTYNSSTMLWENVCKMECMSLDDLKELTKELNGDLRLYKCYVYSPSDTRNVSFAALDVTLKDTREERLNKASNGAWDIVKEKVKKMKAEGKSRKDIQLFILKSMPRFGQLKAGSLNLGKITSWAYLRTTFKTYAGETIDGTAYLKASFVANAFSKILGIKISTKAVEGMFIQARPDMQKGAYLVIPDLSFEVLLKVMSTKEKMTYHGSEKDNKEPVMLVDSNLVKVESNYDENDICLELLEIAGVSSANYSKQAHEKVLAANIERAQDLLWRLGVDHISGKFEKLLEAETNIPTPGKINKGYVSDIVSDIAPSKVLESPALLRATLKNTVQSCVNSVDKLKFSIEGSNPRLTADMSELFIGEGRENSIIKYGEIYAPHAIQFFKKKLVAEAIEKAKADALSKDEAKKFIMNYVKENIVQCKVSMIKYPSMGVKEYYLARPLTLGMIHRRIDNLNTTDEIKKALKDIYSSISDGVSVLPSLKVVMFQCAGLDYDYDGATLIYDQEYCDILSEVEIEATCME